MSENRFVIGAKDGWLEVLRDPSQEKIALPEYLLVDFVSNKNGRDFFTVIEGHEKGNKFSVRQGWLQKGLPTYKPPAAITFSIEKKELIFPGGKVYAVGGSGAYVTQEGRHPIQIPDFPHEPGLPYRVYSQYATVWFHIGRGRAITGSNSNYLHCGIYSLGCISVDPKKWTELYKYLILCRSGDAETVGFISVGQ